MNTELVKSQDTARRMQQILVAEKERNKELKVKNFKCSSVTLTVIFPIIGFEFLISILYYCCCHEHCY